MKMFKAFTIISHFLHLYKEQKMSKSAMFFYKTNFLPISPFAFTFRRGFCEKPLLKTTLRHIVCHVYVAKVVAQSKFR